MKATSLNGPFSGRFKLITMVTIQWYIPNSVAYFIKKTYFHDMQVLLFRENITIGVSFWVKVT